MLYHTYQTHMGGKKKDEMKIENSFELTWSWYAGPLNSKLVATFFLFNFINIDAK